MPVPENARIKSNATWFGLNDNVDYECYDGFEGRQGRTGSIVCGDDGWSHKPACFGKYCFLRELFFFQD